MGERLTPQEAFEYVISAAGFEFERTTVLGVMQYVSLYPVGTMVRLNTGGMRRGDPCVQGTHLEAHGAGAH